LDHGGGDCGWWRQLGLFRENGHPDIARSNWVSIGFILLPFMVWAIPKRLSPEPWREWQGARPCVFTNCGMIWNGQGKVDYSFSVEPAVRDNRSPEWD
jgi:hypothetical protein